MIGIAILVFEILMLIFYAIFLRTDSTSTTLASLDSRLFFSFGTPSST